MSRKMLLAVAAIIALLAGCTPDSAPEDQPSLQSTSWTLTALGDVGNVSPALENSEVTIEFDAGEVSGSAGCNQYFGSYSAGRDGTFSVDNMAWTEMACLEPGVMEQEQEYLSTLLEAESYAATDTSLTITGGGRQLEFVTQ